MKSNSASSRSWNRSVCVMRGRICTCGILLCLLLLPAMLCGCGLLAKDTDPGAAGADSQNGNSVWAGEPVPYSVDIEVVDGPKFLKGKMEDLSQLVQLKKEPPDSMLALERRAMLDKDTAVKLLQSQCYYDGQADFSIDSSAKPVKVTLKLIPGQQFTVGKAQVLYIPAPRIPKAFKNRVRITGFWGMEKEVLPPPDFPDSVPGITPGKPVIADDMLNAVKTIPENLHKTGYPLAKVVKSTYTLNKPAHKLDAEILIDPGPPAVMGNIIVKGNTEVSEEYLHRLMPWKPGREPWDDNLVTNYANTLRSLNIFRSVEAKPAPENLVADTAGKREGAAILPVEIVVVPGPEHSVAASARYESDTGFGLEGSWEDRNLFGNGEILRLNAPLSTQESGLKAHFEKPAFLRRDQRLLADAAALWENTEAYEQESVMGKIGLERRLARRWWGGLSFFAEGGMLKDNEHDNHSYEVISPRATLRYDGRNNKLNPSSGTELNFNFKPFFGFYEESFGAFAGTLALTGYYAPLGRKNDGTINDTIVLAGRVEGGGMPGASKLDTIPSSLRYFTGGANSVRGYPYQSIGPRDKDGDPLGGRSYQVVNLESRFMVSENVGIVPFLDGGMVYSNEMPQIIGDMEWGTGIGLRYYTPIGPVRLDIATPLNRPGEEAPVQFYISIGQSF